MALKKCFHYLKFLSFSVTSRVHKNMYVLLVTCRVDVLLIFGITVHLDRLAMEGSQVSKSSPPFFENLFFLSFDALSFVLPFWFDSINKSIVTSKKLGFVMGVVYRPRKNPFWRYRNPANFRKRLIFVLILFVNSWNLWKFEKLTKKYSRIKVYMYCETLQVMKIKAYETESRRSSGSNPQPFAPKALQ